MDTSLNTAEPELAPEAKTIPASAYSTRPPDASLDERIFQGAFKASSRGLWTGLFVGFFVGAAVGAVAALAPLLVGGALSLHLLGTCLVGFGVLGMAKGSSFLSQVGSTAGGVASGTKEVLKEVQASESRITTLLTQAFPQLKNSPALSAQTTASQEDVAIKTLHEQKGFKAAFTKYFNWKVMLTMATLGALGGLAFGLVAIWLPAAAPIAAGAVKLLGLELAKETAKPAAIAAAHIAVTKGFIIVSAAWGSLFGINLPPLINKVSDMFGNVMSGRVFERKKELPGPDIAPVVASQIAIDNPALALPQQSEQTTKHRDMLAAQRQLSATAVGQGV